jgi:beta-mannanase
MRVFLFCFLLSAVCCNGQRLKSVIYDFDGFDNGQTDLPEGDYSYGDVAYEAVSNPLGSSDMLGDRVLRLELTWAGGYGAFGRGVSRYIELDPQNDKINFFFYNPLLNSQYAMLDVVIKEDDNQTNSLENDYDDTWIYSVAIPGGSGWTLYSLPLKDFFDSNAEGNGIFDVGFTQNKGMLLNIEFRLTPEWSNAGPAVFYLDMVCFSEGNLPHGNTILDLPQKNPNDYCLLGAHQYEPNGDNQNIPGHFEILFPKIQGKRLEYVNTFLQWAYDGSTNATALPGNSIQQLINSGYKPIITWEPMFLGYDPLDPAQPNLQKIINGNYNSYIDAFADKLMTYSDTVIVRLMHEFDGDWYPWSVSQNGQDPSLFISAYKKIVDRVRARGAHKVKWLWCPNSDFFPYRYWNWIVSAYPGDSYVDIVGTDIYNGDYPPSLPWWRSFRWSGAEVYYYLTKYFSTKPFFVCELGCRERMNLEDQSSQSKAGWYASVDKELQSNFHLARALIFFNDTTDIAWQVNTSSVSLQSVTDNIWMDDYYFRPYPLAINEENNSPDAIYPNPASRFVHLASGESTALNIFAADGTLVGEIPASQTGGNLDLGFLKDGLYTLSLQSNDGRRKSYKLLVAR